MNKPKYDRVIFNYSEIVNRGDWNDTKAKKKVYKLVYTKVYNEGILKLTQVSTCASLLILYLADNMRDDGMVFSNSIIRKDFQKYCKSNDIDYTEATIKVAFNELKKNELLIEMSRGVMWINPIYLWRGDEVSRIKAMELMFKDRYRNLKVTLE